jgi:predicted TIM-barrel fold metal-dependent hydrolase
MPFGGNDWHALTREDALEPDLPICDPHHHFWDRRPERTPYASYLLPELLEDIKDHNVVSTVFLEARSMYRASGPEEMRPVGEVEFVNGIAAMGASGIYGRARPAASIVGHANLLLGERVEPVLDALQAAAPARFRGIRHSVTWDPHPEVARFTQTPKLLLDESFRAGARVLANKGLSFDAFLYFHQLPELADMARALPDLQIVVNHMGGLVFNGPYESTRDEQMALWRKNLTEVAQCPNVVVKVGGIGQPRTGFDWHLRDRPIGSEELAASMAPLMTFVIDLFGPERCMFESNFPPDKVGHGYTVVFNAFKRLSSGYSATERAALFHDTAVRVYRVET